MKTLSSFLAVALYTTHQHLISAASAYQLDNHHHLPVIAPSPHIIESRQQCNGGPTESNPTKWWRTEIAHNGTTPYVTTDSGYQYYRTVTDYGADPSGGKDSSEAFNLAITSGNRTGSVTTHPVYLSIPPGTYLISSPINLLVNTFLIGSPLSLPTLLASPSLGIKPVINGYDPHQGEGSPNKNFYISLRNVVVSTTRIPSNVKARGVDWSVSQACSLTNVRIIMPRGSEHTGITMDFGGSGKIISDVTIEGGKIGVVVGSQQYTLKNLRFKEVETGIQVRRAWVLTVIGVTVVGPCKYGLEILSGNGTAVGAVSVIDAVVMDCEAGINIQRGVEKGGSSVVLDGFTVSSGSAGADVVGVKAADGNVLLKGGVPAGQVWVLGNTTPEGYQTGKLYPLRRPANLVDSSTGKYFTAPLPQYEKYDISQIVSVTEDPDHKVYGDNQHDDGPAINAILAKAANNCKIVFFPQGIYLTKTTIRVPAGSRIVGEVFSVISGTGEYFAPEDSPQAVVLLDGSSRGTPITQMSDMLITVEDISPGAILLQINGTDTQVQVWNTVMRVGGSIDTKITNACSAANPEKCKAAFALLHLPPSTAGSTGSVYLEDIWGWVADHALDVVPNVPAQNIAVGRGALIESTIPTWLVGTSFEHCVLYQYSLRNAANIFIAGQQTESPYWQGKGTPLRAPAPWTGGQNQWGDPDWGHCSGDDDQCYRAWGIFLTGVTDAVVHGSAMWVFFNKMDDNMWKDPQCLETGGVCQTNMAYVDGSSERVNWFSLSSKSSANLVYTEGGKNLVKQSEVPGGWGAMLAAYLRSAGEGGAGGDGDDDSGGRRVTVGGLALGIGGLFAFWMLIR
ncbi:glucan 1,3-beta-glucosidase [Podospora australis]|uniref:Glucan 1,3-beta-glucosidase n=1 Tax=Podospora australis TaxID=1536484 RepID=A0AAN6X1N9_9PEZI|nr:glucan 1,3-beta-glucosidase [Podospora australis]